MKLCWLALIVGAVALGGMNAQAEEEPLRAKEPALPHALTEITDAMIQAQSELGFAEIVRQAEVAEARGADAKRAELGAPVPIGELHKRNLKIELRHWQRLLVIARTETAAKFCEGKVRSLEQVLTMIQRAEAAKARQTK